MNSLSRVMCVEDDPDIRLILDFSLGKLGGLIRHMPWVAWLGLIGTIAIAGLPPLNGFVSEWLLLQAFLATPGLPPLDTLLLGNLGPESFRLFHGMPVQFVISVSSADPGFLLCRFRDRVYLLQLNFCIRHVTFPPRLSFVLLAKLT